MRARCVARGQLEWAVAVKWWILAAALLGCSSPETPHVAEKVVETGCVPGADTSYLSQPFEDLASYCQVDLVDGAIVPKSGVLPYDLNTPLFSDFAVKKRTVWLPPGTTATPIEGETLDFPVGTVITKSFGFPDDARKPSPRVTWIETRVMVRTTRGWQMHPYTWDAAQKRATLDPAGGVRTLSFIDEQGATVAPQYLVPGANQCKKCHQRGDALVTLGPKPSNLKHGDQLERWVERGFLARVPDAVKMPVWNDPATGNVEQRARAWLDVNCAHCHRADGSAKTTGLFLRTDERDPYKLGACKSPVAAGRATGGRTYDVVPGDPDASILLYRLQATEPAIAMPEIGRSVAHPASIDLIRQWITGLPGQCDE